MDFKQSLKGKLSQNEFELLGRSFDSVGDIAILEIPRELKKCEKLIANAFLSANPSFKVVATKAGGHGGKFRVQKVRLLAGEKRTLTVHKESGLSMLVDVDKVYFSPRLSSERLRITKLIKPGERVLVLFSGVAPYALVIAKHSKAKHVTAIELNPVGHKLALKNIALNKLDNKVTAIKANAKSWCAKTKERFDRVIMPLPLTGMEFLPGALRVCAKGATLHFYTFAHQDAFEPAAELVKQACKDAKRTCKIIDIMRVGQQSPHVYRVSVDAKIN